MTQLNETLRAGDLRNTIKTVFSIDSHKSKIGEDNSIVVLNFVLDTQDAADDLENFIEMGYNFVLDADASAGETDEGKFSVFVELERTRHSAEQILEIIDGIKKLADLDEMRFRYFKSFKSYNTTLDNLELMVPINKREYDSATEKNRLDNFSEFFSNSYADEIRLLDESISFKRTYSGSVVFDIINSGNKKDIYDSIKGPIILETKNMAEVMFLTKVIGNYNINKIGDTFIFENNGWAVALKRKA
jgi:hypothetical protein